jgi:hypothetical protein
MKTETGSLIVMDAVTSWKTLLLVRLLLATEKRKAIVVH